MSWQLKSLCHEVFSSSWFHQSILSGYLFTKKTKTFANLQRYSTFSKSGSVLSIVFQKAPSHIPFCKCFSVDIMMWKRSNSTQQLFPLYSGHEPRLFAVWAAVHGPRQRPRLGHPRHHLHHQTRHHLRQPHRASLRRGGECSPDGGRYYRQQSDASARRTGGPAAPEAEEVHPRPAVLLCHESKGRGR